MFFFCWKILRNYKSKRIKNRECVWGGSSLLLIVFGFFLKGDLMVWVLMINLSYGYSIKNFNFDQRVYDIEAIWACSSSFIKVHTCSIFKITQTIEINFFLSQIIHINIEHLWLYIYTFLTCNNEMYVIIIDIEIEWNVEYIIHNKVFVNW